MAEPHAKRIFQLAIATSCWCLLVGVYRTPYDGFPFGQLFERGVRIATGQSPTYRYIDALLQFVVDGGVRLDDIISHRLPLAQPGEAYRVFDENQDECVKVLLTP